VGSALLAASVLAPAAVQAYPDKPVRIIVPFLAGSAPDMLTRTVGEQLSARWGQPVIVDNRPGASGAIGAQAVKSAAPDGHTLLMAVSSLVQLPHLLPNTVYDPIVDFAPISQLGGTHLALLVNGELPVDDVPGFVEYAKARPGQINYASYGAGSLSHIFGEVFKANHDLDIAHIAYKGDSPALMDLIEGRVQSAFLSVFLARQFVDNGKIKMLGVTGTTRSPLVPDVPILKDVGAPGLTAQGWFGLFAPAGTPDAVLDQVAIDVQEVLDRPEIREKLLQSGIVAGNSTRDVFTDQVKADYTLYGDLMRRHQISLN